MTPKLFLPLVILGLATVCRAHIAGDEMAAAAHKFLDSLTPEQRDEFKPVAIEQKAGECSFHHPLMVHGSYANQTAKPRRAVVINAFRDGVVSASDTSLLEGVPTIPAGQKIDGQFFPLLFDPDAIKK